MPNGKEKQPVSPLEFPEFPTPFGEKEQARLEQLEEQKKRMEEVYKAKFAPEAWKAVPAPEKVVREWLAPTALKPFIKAVTPWQWGFDFGFIPSQFEQEAEKVSLEYKELARREQVTSVLPTVIETLRTLALSQETIITDMSQLRAIFKLDELGFNEEEVAYIVRIAQSLLKATPEQLIEGEPWGLPPITDEEMEYLREPLFLDPRFIMSTVAFSKDVGEIQQALMLAYPPQVAEEAFDTRRDRIIKAYAEKIKKAEGETNTDAAKRFFEGLSSELGEPIILSNEDTGQGVIGQIKKDNTVWVAGEQVGYYDEAMNTLVPVDQMTGKPLISQEEQEFPLTKFFSNLYKGMRIGVPTAWENVETALGTVLPIRVGQTGAPVTTIIPIPTDEQWRDLKELREILPPSIYDMAQSYFRNFPFDEAVRRTIERINYFNSQIASTDAWAMAKYEESQKRLENFFEEHPDLVKPEYALDPITHPELLKDPGYYGYTIGSAAPPMIAAFGVGIATGLATRNPLAGAVAGAAVFDPIMKGAIFDDMIAAGASPNTAASTADVIGSASTVVEIVPTFIFLRVVQPTFMRIFGRAFRKQLTVQVAKSLSWKGLLQTGAVIEVSEVTEEVIQEVLNNVAVKTVDENRNLLENTSTVAVQSAIAMLPFTGIGAGSAYFNMKAQLPPETGAKIGKTVKDLDKADLTPEHKEAIALAKVLETEEGQAQVELAQEKAEEQVKPEPDKTVEVVKNEKLTNLQNKLTSINGEIETFSSSLQQQRDRLAKMTLPHEIAEQQDIINDLLEQIDELIAKKKRTIGSIEKVRQVGITPVVKAPVAPGVTLVTPEVTSRVNELLGRIPANVRVVIKDFKVDTKQLAIADFNPETGIITFNTENFTDATFYHELMHSIVSDAIKRNDYTMLDDFGKAAGITIERGVAKPVYEEGLADLFSDYMTGKTVPENVRPFFEKWFPIGVTPVAPEVTIQSVAARIRANERLTIEESQFYNKNFEEVEAAVTPTVGIPVKEAERLARAGLAHLIPDLKYEPSQSMPRLPNLKAELERLDTALSRKPNLKKLLPINRELEARRDLAKANLEGLQRGLKEAEEAGEEETVKENSKELKRIAKGAGLGSKDLLTKPWDELPPADQDAVALSIIPDHSLGIGWGSGWKDTALVMDSAQSESGLPFYVMYERIITASLYAGRLQDEYYRRIAEVPRWRNIVRDDKKMGQVALIIDSRREGSKTPPFEPVTDEDFTLLEIADEMSAVRQEWEPWVRFQRFVERYEDNPTADFIAEKLNVPDELKHEVQEAINILETNGGLDTDLGENALWHYLGTKTWGVMKSGYDPWRIYNPGLETTEPPWTAVRGSGYLLPRETTELPWNQQVGVFQRYDSYNISMALRVLLSREVRHLADYYNLSKSKWANPDIVRGYLDEWLRAVQRMPEQEMDFIGTMSTRVAQWAYPNIFWHPRMGYRNVLQFVWSFPYREELVRSVWEKHKLPASLKAIGAEYFAVAVDQSGKPLRNWMFKDIKISILGEEAPPWVRTTAGVISKPFDFLAAQTGKIPTIAVTDKASRAAAYWSMMVRAWRATEQFKKDGNVKRWFKNSGIDCGYIKPEQQKFIVSLLALGDDTISWGVPGLQEVSGYYAATIKIAQEVTNRTLYMYDRGLGAQVHRQGLRALKSLLTFPRSTIQMYGMLIGRAMNKELSFEQRMDALRKIAMLWLTGELLSAFLVMTTGRRRKEYTVVNTVTWMIGGLSLGILMDIFDVINGVLLAGAGSEEDKGWARQRVIQQLPRLSDALVGFYGMMMDVIEAATDEPAGLDRRWLREIRALIEEDYTPEAVEKANRSALEIVQKILFGTEPPPPGDFERAQNIVMTAESNLGTIGLGGESFTVKQFAGIIEQATNNIPDFLLIEEANWTPLTMFYFASRDRWAEYDTLPTTPTSIRYEWRESHLEEEAAMLFWGKLGVSRFRRGSPEGKEIMELLRFWWNIYDIGRSKRPEATWLDGGKIAEE